MKFYRVYLRRDQRDYDSFFLEVGCLEPAILCHLHIDTICHLFGAEAIQIAQSFAPGERRVIKLEIEIPSLTQEENQECN